MISENAYTLTKPRVTNPDIAPKAAPVFASEDHLAMAMQAQAKREGHEGKIPPTMSGNFEGARQDRANQIASYISANPHQSATQIADGMNWTPERVRDNLRIAQVAHKIESTQHRKGSVYCTTYELISPAPGKSWEGE